MTALALGCMAAVAAVMSMAVTTKLNREKAR